MITQVEPRHINANNIVSEKTCNVNINAHLMRILSGLYADPIKAIVREYMSNVADAYRALKRQNPNATIIPAEIIAPTPLEPTMVFKDYGIGMDEETLESVFFTYNASTKNQNNDDIGGFGLGAKTAYTYNSGSPWTVESRYNGKLFQYIAYVNKDGVSAFTKISVNDTSEPNGITIKIAVKKYDIPDFRRWVSIFCFFCQFPYSTNIDVMKASVSLMNPGKWTIFDLKDESESLNHNHNTYDVNGIRIIIGGVPYQYVPSKYDVKASHKCIAIEVPIGEIQLTPNRDEMVNSRENSTKLESIWLETINDIQSKMVENKTFPTKWEEFFFYISMGKMFYGNPIVIPSMSFPAFTSISTVNSALDSSPIQVKHEYEKIIRNPQNLLRQGVKIHINDINHKITPELKSKLSHVVFIDAKMTKAEVSTLFGGFPESSICYLSEIISSSSRQIRYSVSKNTKNNDMIRSYEYNTTTRKWSYGPMISIKTTTPIHYVVISKDFSRRDFIEDFHQIYFNFNADIIGVGESHVKRIIGNSNYIPLSVGIEELIKTVIKEQFTRRGISVHQFANILDFYNSDLLGYMSKNQFIRIMNNLGKITNCQKMKEYCNVVNIWNEIDSNNLIQTKSFITIAEKIENVKYEVGELKNLYKILYEKNPFLTGTFLEKFDKYSTEMQGKMIKIFQDAGVLDIST